MNPKIYILTFDHLMVNASQVHQAVLGAPGLTDWWHYLAPTYLIQTTATPLQLETHFNNHVAGRFFLVEVSPSTAGGWLPVDAWNWINSKR